MSPPIPFTLLTVPPKLWYLAPGMPVEMLTIPTIKKILEKHDINYGSCAQKADFVAKFLHTVAKNRAALYAQAALEEGGEQMQMDGESDGDSAADEVVAYPPIRPRRRPRATPQSPSPAAPNPTITPGPSAAASRQASVSTDADALGSVLSRLTTQLSVMGEKMEMLESCVNKDMGVMRGAVEAITEVRGGGGRKERRGEI